MAELEVNEWLVSIEDHRMKSKTKEQPYLTVGAQRPGRQ